MLLEPVQYQGNLPFAIDFINIISEPSHCHKEMEILLVLRGTACCRIFHMDYKLGPGDMIIADAEDLHRIHHGSPDILMLQLHIDSSRFEDLYPNISYMFFVCENPDLPEKPNQEQMNRQWMLRQLLAKAALAHLDSPMEGAELTDIINEILDVLIHHFRGFYLEGSQYRMSHKLASSVDLDRISRITRYLMNHYDRPISLEEVAASEHLNPYYVSHLVKKNLGVPFQRFVNSLRLEASEKKLLSADLTLTQVAASCGFSSLHYFNQCFKSWYGCTPADYRDMPRETSRHAGWEFSKAEGLELICGYLSPVTTMRKLTFSPGVKADGRVLGKETLRPHVVMGTPEDLLGLGLVRDKLMSIHPLKIHLDEKTVSSGIRSILDHLGLPLSDCSDIAMPRELPPPAVDTASALDELLASPGVPLYLFGEGRCLFLRGGLPTPYFTAMDILSQMEPDSLICTDCIVTNQGEPGNSMILFNPDPREILHIHIHTEGLPSSFILMKRQIPEGHNCYRILDDLGHPASLPRVVLEEIQKAPLGTPHFRMVDKSHQELLDFILYPKTIILLNVLS